MLNDTTKPVITTTSAGYKIDCAKECPCGVPVIPVPDQWLEVMVTGGFKVWHIIFIIIAFLVTIVVVYCCFHRCRIPRTKQEIEADLMRSNLTNKFREYLQEFPNEPTTFLEALKRVQDLEEKSEQDDTGARKRKGWLKRMGKERGEKSGEPAKEETTVPDNDPAVTAATAGATTTGEALAAPAVDLTLATRPKELDKTLDHPEAPLVDDKTAQSEADVDQPKSKVPASKKTLKSKTSGKVTEKPQKREGSREEVVVDKSARTKSEKFVATSATAGAAAHDDEANKSRAEATNAAGRPARARRKRDKPNLSRAKATHGGESIEASNNVLTIPVASHHHHHHHHHSINQHEVSHDHQVVATSQHGRVRSKTKEPRESTVIQIDPSPAPGPAKSKKKDKK